MVDGKNTSTKDIYENVGELFAIKKTTPSFPGFRAVDGIKPQAPIEPTRLLKVKKADIKVVDHETNPPARYNQSSLIKLMKEEGIGRPSTYSATTTGLIKHGYLESVNSSLRPTAIAVDVNKLLESTFADLIDSKYTAKMEDSLDNIATHEVVKEKFLHEF